MLGIPEYNKYLLGAFVIKTLESNAKIIFHYESLQKFFQRDKHLRFVAFICISIFIHSLFLYLLVHITPKKNVLVNPDKDSSSKMHVTLNPEKIDNQKQRIPNIEKNKTKRTLVQRSKPTRKEFVVPHTSPAISEKTKSQPVPEASGMDRFMPNASQEFMQKLQNSAQQAPQMTADGGDIPLTGTERRLDIPTYADRYVQKDLSLFQFGQIFKERFGSAWNAEDRWLPPTSPLRPGNVIYYKVFINSDGSLNHYQNISHLQKPNMDYSHLDEIFAKVIPNVFPLPLPAKLAQEKIVTQILAIQVVDKNLFMRFGF